MAETFRWWLVVEVIGFIGLPIAHLFFRRLPDRGYAFAKPLTILLGGYLFWLFLSLHLMANRPGSVFLCFLALGLASYVIFRRHRAEIGADFRRLLVPIVVTEVIFTGVLFTVAHLRSFLPEIAGTEKPMDFMYLNSASRSHYYPPADAWLSGFKASYYYFGYVIQAMLAKLADVPTAVAFNVALASTAALGASAAYGLGFNLIRMVRRDSEDVAAPPPAAAGGELARGWQEHRTAIFGGCAAVLFLLVLGNLEGVLEFARANGIGSTHFFHSVGIANLPEAKRSTTWYPTDSSSFWWWWRATRISPDGGTITEFPFFSFLLGDLHPHVMAIPFVLTAIGASLALYLSDEVLDASFLRRCLGQFLIASILFGGLGFLNTWDLPTFGALLALLVVARNARGRPLAAALRVSAGFLIPLLVLAVVAYLPFYLSFHSQASGLGAVANGATRPLQSVLFWLPLVVLTLPLVLWRLAEGKDTRLSPQLQYAAVIPILLLVAWAVLLAIGKHAIGHAVTARGWNWTVALFFGAAFVASATALWREARSDQPQRDGLTVVLALTTVAYLLVFGAEFFFVKDVFGSRINTVFKLYYQAWLLLALAAAFSTYWLVQEWHPSVESVHAAFKGGWSAAAAVVVACALLYPVGATLSRTNGLHAKNRTLDGLAFARTSSADDIAIVDWLHQRAGQGEYVLEGVKSSYSDAARISAWSGVPTPLGWSGHEVQWGRSGALLADREKDITQAYTTTSLADALAILQKYDVTYVVVGNLERSLYPDEGLRKFEGALDVALAPSLQTTIYRVPVSDHDSSVKAP